MKRGFTLIEMLVVVVIIGILAGLMVASFQKARVKAYRTRAATEARELAKAWEMFYLTYERIPGGLSVMDAAAVAILQGNNASENPNNIKFYEFPAEAQSAGFKDPWGHLYHVSQDTEPSTNTIEYMTRVYLLNRRASQYEL